MVPPQGIIVQRYCSPCGELLLGDSGGTLCLCDWRAARHHAQVLARIQRAFQSDFSVGSSLLLESATRSLDAFFSGAHELPPLPLRPCGTNFQRCVWEALQRILPGQSITYGELAKQLGIPTAVRAVANACGANALSLFIPCHRVTGSHGNPGGYAGGSAAKHYILDLERNT